MDVLTPGFPPLLQEHCNISGMLCVCVCGGGHAPMRQLPVHLLPSEPLPPGEVRYKMRGNYQVEQQGFCHRFQTAQRQFVAVDNDRVARNATQVQLTVQRVRRPLQRTLFTSLEGGNYRLDEGGGALFNGYYHYRHRFQFMAIQGWD